MLLERGCLHARFGKFLCSSGRGRETLHSVSVGFRSFADNGQCRRLSGTRNAIQAHDFLARDEDVVHGLPLRWQSEITAWEPQRRFVDEERHGPYRLWCHEHTFELREGGTLCRDHVRYAVAFDFLVHRPFVRPDIERIFAYRQEKLRHMFAPELKSIPCK